MEKYNDIALQAATVWLALLDACQLSYGETENITISVCTIYYKYIASLLDESLSRKYTSSSKQHQSERKLLFNAMEKAIGMDTGRIEHDIDIFTREQMVESMHRFAGETLDSHIDFWIKTANNEFADKFD